MEVEEGIEGINGDEKINQSKFPPFMGPKFED